MAEAKKKVTTKTEETKVSLKDKIVGSKPVKWLKVNWKGLLIGFGTGTAAGAGAVAAYNHSQKIKEQQGELEVDELPNGDDPYLESIVTSTDSAPTEE